MFLKNMDSLNTLISRTPELQPKEHSPDLLKLSCSIPSELF